MCPSLSRQRHHKQKKDHKLILLGRTRAVQAAVAAGATLGMVDSVDSSWCGTCGSWLCGSCAGGVCRGRAAGLMPTPRFMPARNVGVCCCSQVLSTILCVISENKYVLLVGLVRCVYLSKSPIRTNRWFRACLLCLPHLHFILFV
jgi:hypothetical protein